VVVSPDLAAEPAWTDELLGSIDFLEGDAGS
jgi:hypothetical protein